MRRFTVGDIHGNLIALEDVLKKVNFNDEEDMLIVLGDVADGYHVKLYECIERIRRIKNRIWVRGNHDAWLLKWFNKNIYGQEEYAWLSQGGYQSRSDYLDENGFRDWSRIDPHHKELKESVLYHIDSDNNLFIHAGIDWNFPIDRQPEAPDIYYWDRVTFQLSFNYQIEGKQFPYKTVFIGHTATPHSDCTRRPHCRCLEPIQQANLWNIDQGAGSIGRLTLMNVDTFEYVQSSRREEFQKVRYTCND